MYFRQIKLIVKKNQSSVSTHVMHILIITIPAQIKYHIIHACDRETSNVTLKYQNVGTVQYNHNQDRQYNISENKNNLNNKRYDNHFNYLKKFLP